MNNQAIRIRNISKEELEQLMLECDTFSDIFRALGVTVHTHYFKILKIKMREENISWEEFKIKSKNSIRKQAGTLNIGKEIPNDKVFCENSNFISNSCIKSKMFKYFHAKNECAICQNQGIHNNIPLSLQLDHINGVANDNRIENLRFLCPNCHSQTSTYAGKNSKNLVKKVKVKVKKPRKTKINWPDLNTMASLIDALPVQMIAKKLGVSDVSVHKFCQNKGLIRKPQGFWLKNFNKSYNNII